MTTWSIQLDDDTLLIRGPGQLEIVLRHFDARRTARVEGLGRQLLGEDLAQRGWAYRVSPEEPIELECISTGHPGDQFPAWQHELLIGTHITWQLPGDFAQELTATMLAHRRDDLSA